MTEQMSQRDAALETALNKLEAAVAEDSVNGRSSAHTEHMRQRIRDLCAPPVIDAAVVERGAEALYTLDVRAARRQRATTIHRSWDDVFAAGVVGEYLFRARAVLVAALGEPGGDAG